MSMMKSLLGSVLTPELIKKLTDNASSSGASVPSASGVTDNLQAKMLRQKAEQDAAERGESPAMKRGGAVKKMAKGGSASSRADGCATKGKTKGRMISMCGGGMMGKR
jgi:hypothetical protein